MKESDIIAAKRNSKHSTEEELDEALVSSVETSGGQIDLDKSGDVDTERKTSSKVISIIFTIFIYLLSAGIIVAALLFAFNTTPNKSIFGIRYYTVLTGSMAPAYNTGDMIFVQLVDPETIEVGDVVTFNPSSESDAYLTHRVTEKIENYLGSGVTCFRTKGDSNNTEDGFLIEGSRIIGVVRFGVPALGYIVRFIQLRWYLVVPVLIMIGILLYLLKSYFSSSDEDEDGEDDKEDPENDDSSEGHSETDNQNKD